MSDLVGSPDIILVWPVERQVPEVPHVLGYHLRPLPPSEDESWVELHRRAVPSFGRADLESWLARYRRLALPDGILVAVSDEGNEPVATAGSIANDKDGMFPDGGQLAWVATEPGSRGRGLATWLSAVATRRLQQDGFRRMFLCTGDDLTAAIRVYLRLGWVPCLYASDQRDRWSRICDATDHPFDPENWPTRDEYVAHTP